MLILESGTVGTTQPDEQLVLGACSHQLGAFIDQARHYERALNVIVESENAQRQIETANDAATVLGN